MSFFAKIVDPWLMEPFPEAQVYTSLEGEAPGGSIKDHMVKGELEELLERGTIQAGGDIAEISAGSTALSLAFYAQKYHLNSHLFLPDTAPKSLQNNLIKMGARIHLAPMESAYERYQEFIKKEKIHPFNQMFDPQKAKYYKIIGQEFRESFKSQIDAVIGAVGTGHSLEGVAQGACAKRTVSAEPAAGVAVAGVRNLDEQNLGSKDLCLERFKERIMVEKKDFFPDKVIMTDKNRVEIGESFQLVLGAVKFLLKNSPKASVFAVGAKNKRLPGSV
ncbi:MAG: pyridoxal-phosphate dependent enzyme [Bacteriovoracaceae bacterium]